MVILDDEGYAAATWFVLDTVTGEVTAVANREGVVYRADPLEALARIFAAEREGSPERALLNPAGAGGGCRRPRRAAAA